MSSLRKELSEDPLSLFVSSAEAEDISKRAKQSAAIESQKYAQTMSRIGLSASDLLSESLSFGDPLSRPSNTPNAIKSPQRDHENVRQETIPNPSREDLYQKSYQSNNTEKVPEDVYRQRSECPPKEYLPVTDQTVNISSNPLKMSAETAGPSVNQSMRNNNPAEHFAENFAENAENDTKYLSGESPISEVIDSRIQIAAGRSLVGNLVLTNYRLKFVVSKKLLKSINSPSLYSYLNIPLGSIDKIEKEKKTKEQKLYEQKQFNLHNSNNSSVNISSNIIINITCKDMRVLRITMPHSSSINYNNSNNNNNNRNMGHSYNSSGHSSYRHCYTESDIENFIQTIAEVAFPNDRRGLFAFSHKMSVAPNGGNNSNGDNGSNLNSNNRANNCFPNSHSHSQGQSMGQGHSQMIHGVEVASAVQPYDIMKEFNRLSIFDILSVTEKSEKSSLFRISTVNTNYNLCNTYPHTLVVPTKMSDEEIVQSANFRSGHRLPVLCWGDKETGVTMWRSSQPKSGVSGTCGADEKLLELIAQSCVYKRTPTGGIKVTGDPLLCITDCRPKASALANKAAGAGYESQNNYPYTHIYFNNIGNIHVMRESYNSLCNLLLSPIPILNDVSFTKQVEDTNYLTNIRLLLKCSLETVFFMKRNLPVLVHCSHGWDRTAQVTALSQLFLDPYYRTIDGFKILIEKEFLSFGHQFFLRCGHGLNKNTNSRSQYGNSNNTGSNVKQDDQLSPIFFQFLDCTWQLLQQHLHFFEFNSRYLLTLADHIHSCRFGTFLFDSDLEREMFRSKEYCADIWDYLHRNRAALTNPLYMDPNHEDTPTTHSLIPPLSQLLRNVTLWTDYFYRYCSLPTIVTPPTHLSDYLYESGVTIPALCYNNTQTPQPHIPDGSNSPPRGVTAPLPLSLPCPDFELPAMVTSADYWEAAYRREVQKGEQSSSSHSSSSKNVPNGSDFASSINHASQLSGDDDRDEDDASPYRGRGRGRPEMKGTQPVNHPSSSSSSSSSSHPSAHALSSSSSMKKCATNSRKSTAASQDPTLKGQRAMIEKLISLLIDRGMTAQQLQLELQLQDDGDVDVDASRDNDTVNGGQCGDSMSVGTRGKDKEREQEGGMTSSSSLVIDNGYDNRQEESKHHTTIPAPLFRDNGMSVSYDGMCDVDLDVVVVEQYSPNRNRNRNRENILSSSNGCSSSGGGGGGGGGSNSSGDNSFSSSSHGMGNRKSDSSHSLFTQSHTPSNIHPHSHTIPLVSSPFRLSQCDPLSDVITTKTTLKLSSLDLLSALTSIQSEGEGKLFGSPRTGTDSITNTNANSNVNPTSTTATALENKKIINEFY